MKGLVIVNPTARSGLAVAERASHRKMLEPRLQSIASVIEWVETQYPGHAVQLAQDAADGGYDYVFAAGGDGTISEVLNGIMRSSRRPVLGALPWGSLNDFHQALRFAEASTQGHAPTLPLDVGRATFDGIERYAGLSVSVGLAAWSNQKYQLASVRLGRILGLLPGTINGLLSYRFPRIVSLSVDGEVPRPMPMLSVAINNSPTVGGGAKLTPKASVNDGYFDLCLIPPMALIRLARLLVGSYIGQGLDPRAVMLRRVSQIALTAEKPLPVHVDGEMILEIGSLAKDIRLSVLPGELRVLRASLLDVGISHL